MMTERVEKIEGEEYLKWKIIDNLRQCAKDRMKFKRVLHSIEHDLRPELLQEEINSQSVCGMEGGLICYAEGKTKQGAHIQSGVQKGGDRGNVQSKNRCTKE